MMTSLGVKKRDNAELSAKMTAANSYSSRMSHRLQGDHVKQPSARNKTAHSVFYSDKNHPNNSLERPSGEKQRANYNMLEKNLKSIEMNNTLDHSLGGKRTFNFNFEPKTSSYQGQLEYLDRIQSKYQELIHVEEQMNQKKQQIDFANNRAKYNSMKEKAELNQKLLKSTLND